MPDEPALTDQERRRHFENALRNFGAMVDRDLDDQFRASAEAERRPENPRDPLQLLGDLAPMNLTPAEEDVVRELVAQTLEEKGPDYLWNSRVLLKHQLHILLRF